MFLPVEYSFIKIIDIRVEQRLLPPCLKQIWLGVEAFYYALVSNKEIYTEIKNIADLFIERGRK